METFTNVHLTSSEFGDAVDFWGRQLGLTAQRCELCDRTADGNAPPTEYEIHLSGDLHARLRSLADDDELGLLTIALAAWSLALSRSTDSEVVVVRTPRLKGMAPRFADTDELPLIIAVGVSQTVKVHILKVREVVLASYRHQDLPLPFLASERGYPLDACATNVGCYHDGLHDSPPQRIGIMLHVGPKLDWLAIRCAAGALRPSFARDLARRVEAAFERMTRSSQSLGSVSLLSTEEEHLLLRRFNDTFRPFPSDSSVVEIFERRATQFPRSCAVVCGGRRWSYEELNSTANSLARLLTEHYGVGRESRVGVLIGRSEWAIAAFLAALKAGGAYVPLDPSYPQQRIRTMLDIAEPNVVLGHSDFLEPLIACGRPMIAVDLEYEGLPRSAENLSEKPTAADLAYVMFTSGSTGVPKGVMVEHRPIARLTQNAGFLDVKLEDRVLQLGSLSFDAATLEIWGPLLNGATVVMALEDVVGDPRRLRSLLAEERVTCACVTTGLFNQLVELEANFFSGLRCIIVGGERMSPCHAKRALDASPRLTLLNGYGPTENTTYTTTHKVRAGEGQSDVPIGRPIGNSRVYVMGRHGGLAAIGVVGEICAAGAGLARGYLGDPELTARRFVSNPFEPGSTLYRTGDLGYWEEDGALRYVGRVDEQVKVRGFRVELGEIECCLEKHEKVRQAVVVAHAALGGTNELTAYVAAEEALEASALRKFAAVSLPGYMIPSDFELLKALPLTPNGKVDRAALVRARRDEGKAQGVKEAPRTTLEIQLARIWQEVLDAAEIGRCDDFFDLGGHSLVATRIVARVFRELGTEINISDIFLNPTIATLASVIAKRPPMEPEHSVQSLLAIAVPEAGGRGERRRHPLSYAQQRMWILHGLDEEGINYNVVQAHLITGTLDHDAYRRAISALVCRHDVLRTTFLIEDGSPVQEVREDLYFAPVETDLRGIPDAQTRAREIVLRDARKPLDLENDRLFSAHLLRLEEQRYVHYFRIHHILVDAWSTSVLTDDLITLYNAFARGEEPRLEPLAFQYKDFAVWQRKALQTEAFRADRQYWLDRLGGHLPTLRVPIDRERPKTKTHRGGFVMRRLSAEITGRLRELARDEGTSLFVLLLTATQVLLARLSGEEDVIVGVPVAERPHPNLENQVGLLQNTIAIRTHLAGDETFRQLLRRTAGEVLQAYDHRSYPFDVLVEELDLPRDLSRHPIFDVMVVGHTEPSPRAVMHGVSMAPIDLSSSMERSQFDLVFYFEELEPVSVRLEYNLDLFDGSTAERFTGLFETLLQSVVRDETTGIHDLSIMTASEQEQVLKAFNATSIPFRGEEFVHEAFEMQAERTPGRIAAVSELRSLTYRELNERANQLAWSLRAKGVGPDRLVGVCIEPGLEMLVGILATLKAGGAYVPLDPSYPARRIEQILRDAAPRVLLTQAHLKGRLLAVEAEMIAVDADWRAITQESIRNPPVDSVGLRPDHLVYVMYTSGSTGVPKGVMVQHAGLMNYLRWALQFYSVKEGIGSPVTSSLAFDATVTSLYTPLLCGRTVILVGLGEETERLESLLKGSEALSLVKISPAHLSLLGQRWTGKASCAVRAFVVGGEVLSPAAVELWQQIAPHTRLINEYGPTETVVGCSAYVVPAGAKGLSRISIGRPIANTRMYILDDRRRPLPVGVTGEIYVSGTGVARGYLNQPKLTMERFIADPFADDPNARMYKTGDLGRWRADGTLEYLGRNDQQVKIRGFRVEVGEIEIQLALLPQVKDAVVVAREDIVGEKRLVAYITARDRTHGPAELGEAARTHLKAVLPEYMVPAALVVLDELPLTINGKVDRTRLPPPNYAALAAHTFSNPQGATEEAIADVWAQVLQVDRIGRHDHFFELGGSSLLAIQMLFALRKVLGIEPRLRTLFAHPTLERFAEAIDGATDANVHPNLVPIRSRGSRAPLFFVHPGEGEVGYVRDIEPWVDMSVPIYGLAARGLANAEVPVSTVQEMASLYLEAIRSVQSRGPYRVAGWSAGGVIAYELAYRLTNAGEDVEFLGLIDSSCTLAQSEVHPAACERLDRAPTGADEMAALISWIEENVPEIPESERNPAGASANVDALLIQCQRFGRLPRDVGVDVLRRHLAVRISIRNALRSYSPPSLSVPFWLFAAIDSVHKDPTLGWASVPGAHYQIVPLSGTHYGMMERPYIVQLGAEISARLTTSVPEESRAFGETT